jgi:hypothetical protein
MRMLRASLKEFQLLQAFNPLTVDAAYRILRFLNNDTTALMAHGLVSLVTLLMNPLVNHQRFLFRRQNSQREETTFSGGLLLHSHTAWRDMLHALHKPELPGWFFDIHTSTFVPFALPELPEIVYICNEGFGREKFFTSDLNSRIVTGDWEGSMVILKWNDANLINKHQSLTPRPDSLVLNLLQANDTEAFIQTFVPEGVRYGIGSARTSVLFDTIYNALLGGFFHDPTFIANLRVGASRYYLLKLANKRFLSVNKLTGFFCRTKPAISQQIFDETFRSSIHPTHHYCTLDIFELNRILSQKLGKFIRGYHRKAVSRHDRAVDFQMVHEIFDAFYLEIRICTAAEADDSGTVGQQIHYLPFDRTILPEPLNENDLSLRILSYAPSLQSPDFYRSLDFGNSPAG